MLCHSHGGHDPTCPVKRTRARYPFRIRFMRKVSILRWSSFRYQPIHERSSRKRFNGEKLSQRKFARLQRAVIKKTIIGQESSLYRWGNYIQEEEERRICLYAFAIIYDIIFYVHNKFYVSWQSVKHNLLITITFRFIYS